MMQDTACVELKEHFRGGLKMWLLEKVQQWVNGLLEGEFTEQLGRTRYARAETAGNYRNGHRPLHCLGLGRLHRSVPRDRAGDSQSYVLPERQGQDEAMEAFISEGFLARRSIRNLARITEQHLGTRDNSKEVSRIVERASTELDAWQNRPLARRAYQLLFVDGTHVRIRIKQWVEPLAFCVVLAISAQAHVIKVLGVMMGDREQLELWAQLFQDLARQGLDMNAVELRVTDGLTGLETCFTQHFSRAQPQRCQKHASANPVRRVQKADRKFFSQELNKVFYGTTEAEARNASHTIKARW